MTFTSNSFTDEDVTRNKETGETKREINTFNYRILDFENGAGHMYVIYTSGKDAGYETVSTFVINGNELNYRYPHTYTKK